MIKSEVDIHTSFDQSFNKSLFQVKDRIYTWKDVLAHGEFLGTLKTHLKNLEEGIVSCKYAELNGTEINPEEIQCAANALRYRLNLITAEETEEWLRSRELSLRDLNTFLCRNIFRSYFANELNEIRGQVTLNRADIFNDLWPEFVLSEVFPKLVIPLVWRTIISDLELISTSSINDFEIKKVGDDFCLREGQKIGESPGHLKSCLFLQENFDFYLILEAKFRKYCEQILTQESAELLLKLLHKHLIRIEYESASFVDLEHAREAFLCVTEDGLSLNCIASQTGGSYIKSTQFLDEIPETLRRLLLSAGIEEAIPPRAGEKKDEFYIHRVLKKIEPKIEDPQVVFRLRRECMKENLGPIAKAKITWLKWDVDLLHG